MFQSYYAGDDVGVFIHEEFHHLILSEGGAKNSFYIICIERERERETQQNVE